MPQRPRAQGPRGHARRAGVLSALQRVLRAAGERQRGIPPRAGQTAGGGRGAGGPCLAEAGDLGRRDHRPLVHRHAHHRPQPGAHPALTSAPAEPEFGGQRRVAQEHGDREWADAAGDRRDPAGDGADGREIHVADEPAFHAVDADVDDGRARLHHVGRDQARPADRGHEDVGLPRDGGEVVGTAVTDRDRRVAAAGARGRLGREQQRQGPADDVAAADDHGVPAGGLDPGVDQHPLHPGGRAGDEPRPALRQEAGVLRMEAVHVAVRRHRVEHGHAVDVRRQRQLHEDAVSRPVLLAGDRPHERHDIGRVRGGRHGNHLGVDADTCGGGGLALYVGGARRLVADEHHDEPGWASDHGGEGPHLIRERRLDPLREGPAVEKPRRHRVASAQRFQ